MPRSLTLLQFRTELRFLSDTEGATDRHPDANLTSLINRRWARAREMVSELGCNRFLTSTTGNTTAAQEYIPWPTDAVRIESIELTANSVTFDLSPGSLNERNEYRVASTDSGIPQIYVPGEAPKESTTSVIAGKIYLFPTPSSALPYRLWYLPEWVDLSNDTHVFSDPIGMSQWVLWDCAAQLAFRDNESVYAAAVQERDRELNTLRRLCAAQRQAPLRRSDTRARRARARFAV